MPYAATALLTLLFCGYIFDLRHQDLRLPMGAPFGDYLMGATIVKGVMQNGWYTTNPMVGAPQGLEFHDFPMAEGLHFVFYQIAGLLHLPVVLAMNLHYLLGYVLIALTSLYVFLALRLPAVHSIAAGILLAFMPHHWMPGQVHLLLGSYYMIPLTVLVILWLSQGEEFVQGSRWRYRLTRRGVAAAVISVLTGSAGIYYALFGIAFLAIMTVFRLVRRRSLSQALSGLIPITLISLSLLLNMSPNVLYWMRHGVNQVVAKRGPVEADLYGLKMMQLLVPISTHRIPLLAHWKSTYWSMENPYVPNNDLIATLGAVASFGFLTLVAWLFFRKDDHSEAGQLLTNLSILNMSALLIATIGGFGSLFAFVVSPQIRVYSRISIYIAFFSLAAVLVLIKRAASSSKSLQFIFAVVMFAGLWDITPRSLATPYFRPEIDSDRSFIHAIESAVPQGSMIYQMPYHPFPEHGFTNKMQDYDPFRGYIYSDNLKWSYGAMEGRPADAWQKHVASLPLAEMVSTISGAGFRGIYIDTLGYIDGGEDVIKRLSALLPANPIRSADQRFIFFPASLP
jgi:hypothetical protein